MHHADTNYCKRNIHCQHNGGQHLQLVRAALVLPTSHGPSHPTSVNQNTRPTIHTTHALALHFQTPHTFPNPPYHSMDADTERATVPLLLAWPSRWWYSVVVAHAEPSLADPPPWLLPVTGAVAARPLCCACLGCGRTKRRVHMHNRGAHLGGAPAALLRWRSSGLSFLLVSIVQIVPAPATVRPRLQHGHCLGTAP
jgi:hypothetical protein